MRTHIKVLHDYTALTCSEIARETLWYFLIGTEKRIDSKKRTQRAALVAYPNCHSASEESLMQQMTRVLDRLFSLRRKGINLETLF